MGLKAHNTVGTPGGGVGVAGNWQESRWFYKNSNGQMNAANWRAINFYSWVLSWAKYKGNCNLLILIYMAEEVGVEPTRHFVSASLVLKTRRPTGDIALPCKESIR
jgi:hypothetical protein